MFTVLYWPALLQAPPLHLPLPDDVSVAATRPGRRYRGGELSLHASIQCADGKGKICILFSVNIFLFFLDFCFLVVLADFPDNHVCLQCVLLHNPPFQ